MSRFPDALTLDVLSHVRGHVAGNVCSGVNDNGVATSYHARSLRRQPLPLMQSIHRTSCADVIAGVDEAGRGPLAGPVVVAAVILDRRRRINGLADSKVLSEKQRDALAPKIRARSLAWSIVAVDTDEIEELNILGATLIGMTRALLALSIPPTLALIDGNRLPAGLPCAARTIIGGDATEAAISAASILAKTFRDALMRECDARHPGYGFARHKGYGTPEHLLALAALGPCPIHRRFFAPVQQRLMAGLF